MFPFPVNIWDNNETNETKECNDTNETKETSETKEASETKETNVTNETIGTNETNETNETKETKETKETREPRESRESREPKETKETGGRVRKTGFDDKRAPEMMGVNAAPVGPGIRPGKADRTEVPGRPNIRPGTADRKIEDKPSREGREEKRPNSGHERNPTLLRCRHAHPRCVV